MINNSINPAYAGLSRSVESKEQKMSTVDPRRAQIFALIQEELMNYTVDLEAVRDEYEENARKFNSESGDSFAKKELKYLQQWINRHGKIVTMQVAHDLICESGKVALVDEDAIFSVYDEWFHSFLFHVTLGFYRECTNNKAMELVDTLADERGENSHQTLFAVLKEGLLS